MTHLGQKVSLVNTLPYILIVGRRNSGKSTLGRLVASHEPSWKSIATSDVTIGLFASQLGLSPEEVKKRKDSLRSELISLSYPLVAEDPGVFVRMAMKQGNIINGIRHAMEFETVRDWFDLTVFISRPECEIYESDNYNIPTILTAGCDVQIFNVGNDVDILDQAAQHIISLVRSKTGQIPPH